MKLLYVPWKTALLQNTSESTKRSLATWKKTGTPSSRPQDGQLMPPRTKGHYSWSTQEQTGTFATPWSPHQPSWKVHWHFQVSSYFWTKRHGPKFPFAPLVPHSAAVPRCPKHAAHLPPPPSYVTLHTRERNLRLQRHTHSATALRQAVLLFPRELRTNIVIL